MEAKLFQKYMKNKGARELSDENWRRRKAATVEMLATDKISFGKGKPTSIRSSYYSLFKWLHGQTAEGVLKYIL